MSISRTPRAPVAVRAVTDDKILGARAGPLADGRVDWANAEPANGYLAKDQFEQERSAILDTERPSWLPLPARKSNGEQAD